MKEIIFMMLAEGTKAKIVAGLLKIKMNEDDFASILKAAHSGLQPLARLFAQTETKIDDTALGIPLEAIEEVAKFKGIEL